MISPLADVRRALADVTLSPLRVGSVGAIRFDEPAGDPGWFGPDSVMWHMCTDWPSMLVGGFSGLILGTLHPLVLAGTLDHSNFNEDPIGRLARTGSFVSATAYGSSVVAERAVAHVRALHEHVVGVAPDGRPYRAQDPELLLWTHMTVYAGFIAGHRRYHPRPATDLDRYWAEIAIVAEKLGASRVPRSATEADEYFLRVRPELVASEDALRSSQWIINAYRGDTPALRDSAEAIVTTARSVLPRRVRSIVDRSGLGVLERATIVPAARIGTRFAYTTIVKAAIGLLPGWGREMLRLPAPRVGERVAVRAAAASLFTGLRWTAGTTPRELEQARARAVGTEPQRRSASNVG